MTARRAAYAALGVLAPLFAWLSWLCGEAWMRCEVARMGLDPWAEISEELT